jgi:hypothetical protein
MVVQSPEAANLCRAKLLAKMRSASKAPEKSLLAQMLLW